MKQLTEEQANAVLAEQVMGWEGAVKSNWNPATNPAHRDEALEAWRIGNESIRHIDIGIGFGLYCVSLLEGMTIISTSTHKSFCTAIVNAILQAIGAGQIGG